MLKPIYSITPFTLLDYPNHPACILWFAGCNMRCVYCYNPEIVLGKGKLSVEDTISFLKSRQTLLQAVVFSGGECTLHPDIFPLARAAKDMGYLIKVDTNGTKPQVLKSLLAEQLIDFVALDFKGIGSKHQHITQSRTFATFSMSLSLLQTTTIPFEVRTTWHSALLNVTDIHAMVKYLEQHNFQGDYFIQHFMNNVQTLETLPYAQHTLDISSLSTSNIRVKVRKPTS